MRERTRYIAETSSHFHREQADGQTYNRSNR